MVRYRLAAAARTDLVDILAWTHGRGEAARRRHEVLVVAALRDLSTKPDRAGSIARPEIGEDVRSWHLRLNREHGRTGTGIVCRQRRFLLYRLEKDLVVVGRVLHDAMELEQQLDPDESWE